MLYCANCQRLVPEEGAPACETCGDALRAPLENDPVLLISAGAMKADMIAPLLEDMGIPFAKVGDLGVGFTMWAGRMMETYRFYVPYGVYDNAREWIENTFGEDEEIMHALK